MVYKRGEVWWYKFTWNGELIRESTKQGNKRIAGQIESAHKTSLAKGEVGLRDKKYIPTLKDFLTLDFFPFIEARFTDKPNTLDYYKNGVRGLNAFEPLAGATLDTITADKIGAYVAKLREEGFAVGSINRRLEVLRRAFKLAAEWGKVEKVLPKVEMLPGETHRDRVLSDEEETRYLDAATGIGNGIELAYQSALKGIRATMRGEEPIKPEDPFTLRDAAALLMDCALRPDELFRLRWEQIRDDALNVTFGKTKNARRTIPLTPRAAAFLEMRRAVAKTEWVFPAPTRSGHIGKSTLKKRHANACKLAEVPYFVLYTFRHTCLTRWAEYMDPYTLAYLAGHSDFSTTRRYVHPQAHTIRDAMARARMGRGGHNSGHSEATGGKEGDAGNPANEMQREGLDGRGGRIRTSDLLVPNQALYQAEPRPEQT